MYPGHLGHSSSCLNFSEGPTCKGRGPVTFQGMGVAILRAGEHESAFKQQESVTYLPPSAHPAIPDLPTPLDPTLDTGEDSLEVAGHPCCSGGLE